MPRVKTKTKNRGGRPEYRCDRCADPIVAGDQYHEWSFRYGGTHRQHTKHGHPRQSQLTQSKMRDVYAAVEEVEDLIASGTWSGAGDLQDALANVAEVANTIAEEYREASEPFGYSGENAERADEVESFASEVEQVYLDEFDPEDDETEDEWRERIESEAEAAISSAP